MNVGDRVRLTDDFIVRSTNPDKQATYRGRVEQPTTHSLSLGPSYTLVWWDGNVEPYPVLTHHLRLEDS